MPLDFGAHPGLLYVVATLLPLASFALILLWRGLRLTVKPYRDSGLGSLYQALGGDRKGRGAAYVATGAMGLAFVCSLIGFVLFLGDHAEHGKGHAEEPAAAEQDHAQDAKAASSHGAPERWQQQIEWARVGAKEDEKGKPLHQPGTVLTLGYRIDHLTAVMFLMVTFVGTLIHVYSIGYMGDELQEVVEDHQVHTDHGHLHRPGRFGRFFLFLSLFSFSMLNLVLADNLFQVFVSWELVGICSYLLIGFYFERHSASTAANKAFITNRIGDAGFIIGLLVIWTYVGTFNFEELFERIRSPLRDAHGAAALGGNFDERIRLVTTIAHGVAEQIVENLDQLRAVPAHRRKAFGNF